MASSKSNFSRPNFAQCPLLWLAISYSLGIFLASNCEIDWRIFFGLSVSCAILSLTFINKFHGLLFLFIAFLSSGSFLFQLNEQTQPQNSLKSLYDTKQFISNDPIEIEFSIAYSAKVAVSKQIVHAVTVHLTRNHLV